MRLGRFDQGVPRPCLIVGDHAVDLQGVDPDLPEEPLQILADAGARRRVAHVARGQPPRDATTPIAHVKWLPPVTPGRVVLRGGVDDDFAPAKVLGAGAALPAGVWHTGIAAVVAEGRAAGKQAAGKQAAEKGAGEAAAGTGGAGQVSLARGGWTDLEEAPWGDVVAGFTLFHRVGDVLCIGPWLLDQEELGTAPPLFSAFVDLEPRIRPVKALLDWQGELARAHADTPLAPGDILALAAPPQEASGPVRAALASDGKVVARLACTLGAS